MVDIISSEELTSYLGIGAESNVALFVDLANGIVSEVIGNLTPIPARVMAITLEVAGRPVRNPAGYSSETVDDYTYRLPSETRKAGVYLTDDERAELVGITVPLVDQQVARGAYTVSLGGPDVPNWWA